MAKKFEIRNSTAEFLTFVAEGKEQGIQVLYKDETVWATQKAMAVLFDVDRSVITKHLKNIFETKELQQDSVCAKIAHTAEDGKKYSPKGLSVLLSFGIQNREMLQEVTINYKINAHLNLITISLLHYVTDVTAFFL